MNEAGRNINRPTAYKQPPDYSLPPVLRSKPVTVDTVKAEIRQLRITKEKLKLSLRVSASSGIGFYREYDLLLNRVGDGIEKLAETKFDAPTDHQIQEAMTPFTKIRYFKMARAALNKGLNATDAHELAEKAMFLDYGPQIKEVVGALLEKRNEAYRNALIACGIEFANPDSLEYSKKSEKPALNSVKKALYYCPQAWVDASNEMHNPDQPFTIVSNPPGERSSYTSGVMPDWDDDFSKKIYLDQLTVCQDQRFLVGNDASMRRALHEFSHRVQHSSKDIYLYEKYFLDRRAGLYAMDGMPPEEKTPIYPNKKEGEVGHGEEGICDGFPTHYMGKMGGTKNRAEEILSMGMETLFAGTNGAFVGMLLMKPDPDFKKFMLGLLASTAK